MRDPERESQRPGVQRPLPTTAATVICCTGAGACEELDEDECGAAQQKAAAIRRANNPPVVEANPDLSGSNAALTIDTPAVPLRLRPGAELVYVVDCGPHWQDEHGRPLRTCNVLPVPTCSLPDEKPRPRPWAIVNSIPAGLEHEFQGPEPGAVMVVAGRRGIIIAAQEVACEP